jgi:hypothetical protein
MQKYQRSQLMNEKIEFDVALSFAEEDRETAHCIAAQLRDDGVKVFYDEFFQCNSWDKILYEYISEIHINRAKYRVMLISENFIKNKWTDHERKRALATIFVQGGDCILPVQLDDTVLPGLSETIKYIDLRNKDISHLVDLISERIREEDESFLEKAYNDLLRPLYKADNKGRTTCSVCGLLWAAEEQYFCVKCRKAFCYKCLTSLKAVNEMGTRFRYRCKCGGRVG